MGKCVRSFADSARSRASCKVLGEKSPFGTEILRTSNLWCMMADMGISVRPVWSLSLVDDAHRSRVDCMKLRFANSMLLSTDISDW